MTRQEIKNNIDVLSKVKRLYEENKGILDIELFGDMKVEGMVKHWDTMKDFADGCDIERAHRWKDNWRTCLNPKFQEDSRYRIKEYKYRGVKIDTKGEAEEVQKKLFEADSGICYEITGREPVLTDRLCRSVRFIYVSKEGVMTHSPHDQKEYFKEIKMEELDAKAEWPELFGPELFSVEDTDEPENSNKQSVKDLISSEVIPLKPEEFESYGKPGVHIVTIVGKDLKTGDIELTVEMSVSNDYDPVFEGTLEQFNEKFRIKDQ